MVLKVLFEQSYFTSSTSKCENCRLRIRCRDSNPRPITLYARLNPSQGNVLISFGLIISRVIDRLASPIFSFFKCANPGHFLFIFVHFKHKFYRKNCRRQQDSNSDRRSSRQARWPLDHHHGRSSSFFDHQMIKWGKCHWQQTSYVIIWCIIKSSQD